MSVHESPADALPASAFAHRRVTPPGAPYALAALALAAVVTTNLVDFGVEHAHIALLNADSDASWSHRVVMGLLVIATLTCAFAVWRRRSDRILWAATGAVLAFLAIDEITSLHVQIDRMSWGKAVYAPVLVVLGVAVLRLASRVARRGELLLGVATLAVSFAIHLFGGHIVAALGWGPSSWGYQVKVGLKEGTELAGSLLVLFGLGRLAASPAR